MAFGYYGGWPAYVPVSERRKKAAREIARLKKAGQKVAPVVVEGRKIAASFWGKAWCDNLESYQDYAYRVERGRSYVRNGAVIDLRISPREVRAKVIGSDKIDVIEGSDVVVVTAGAKQQPGQTRMDLAGATISLMDKVLPPLLEAAPNAIYILVTNPVDVVTYAAIKKSGMDPARMFGSGTVLDSSRLRHQIAQEVQVAVGNVHAYIAGEHGGPSFCPLSVLESEADLAWAEDWIAACFELQTSRPPQPGERDAIHRAMLLLRQAGSERTPACELVVAPAG